MENAKAAHRGLGKAAKNSIVNSDRKPPEQDSRNITVTGRELLLSLAAGVRDLCRVVHGWRHEVDDLRARLAELEAQR
jgi:hypothetical protein